MAASPPDPRRPDPRRIVRREILRAFGEMALGPLRLAGYALRRGALRAGVRADLTSEPPPVGSPRPTVPPEPLRLFISCGETSSEAHAARLVRATEAWLREAGAPAPEWIGLGGATLRAAGVELLADPTTRATMGGQGVLGELGFWRDVLTAAATGLRERPCDALAAVDAPALHVPLARIAGRYGTPTVHHVTPQYWAWAPWRVRAYRRAIDRALCILPFEPSWFERHGVRAEYVGHPQIDLLSELPTPPPATDAGRDAIALLPGSRSREIEQVLPIMLEALAAAAPRLGGRPVLVLQSTDEHAPLVRRLLERSPALAELRVGDVHHELARVRAALATSGTVLIDLLHQRIPAVVLYALRGALRSRMVRWLVTVPWFASPNLLAGEEVLPERSFRAERPPAPGELATLLERCANDEEWRARCQLGLERAAGRLGPAGAAERAARHLLEVAARGVEV